MTNWFPDVAGRSGPVYRVIADALADDIQSGRLLPGARLPTHRDLAFHLKVTVGTITRAYAEAERRGLVGGEVGRGTFVLARGGGAPTRPAMWHPPAEPSAIDMSRCEPHTLGVDQALAETVAEVLADGRLTPLLNYAPHTGYPSHREAGAEWLTRYRVRTRPESVMVTVGAQNALAISLAAAARPGDVVVAERLSYYGIKGVTEILGMHLEGLPMDDEGLLPDAFEAACRRLAPKVLYTVPTLQNPTTAIQPPERRHALAEIALRYGVIVVEDDVFGFLVPDVLPIQTLAPEITLYIASLSKSVAAGLRVGFLVAPPSLMPRLEAASQAMTFASPALMAEIATRWVADGRADAFANAQRAEAQARQALARSILPRHLLAPATWGQHLWMTLPEPWRREEFVSTARRSGVAITGADTFMIGRTSAPHAIRLGLCMPLYREDVQRGLEILARILQGPAAGGHPIV